MLGLKHLILKQAWLIGLALCCVLLPVSGVSAQQAGVKLDIQRDFLGVGGVVQRGVWTPVRLDLTNESAENLEVDCRWLLSDADGDELVAERRKITLTPQRTQGVWLYATPPMSTRPDQTWVFQAVDTNSGELVQQVQLQLAESAVVEASVNLVGVCGYKNMGLAPWQRWSTQHEQLRLVQGLNLETLPDRWYGLDGLTSLVWMPVEGGEPTSNLMSDASKRALREWIYRGGHLVIVMPYGGQQWTSADSGLADLIEPIDASAIKQTQARPPISVFGLLRSADEVPLLYFDLANAPGYTTLAQVDLPNPDLTAPNQSKPLIVGKRFGFGQITLVGIDLSETSVLKAIDTFRLHKVWTRIFSWRGSKTGELIPISEFENQQTASQYVEAKNAQHIELGTWIPSRVSRQRQTGPAIGLAIVFFFIYAIAAALTFPNLLRGKGWERHSWVLFVGIVALFSVVAWGGAWVMRPATSSAAHFTVLDIDGNTNMARARSWQSLLIPDFKTAQIAVPSVSAGLPRMEVVNLVASPGLSLNADNPGYPDRRSYAYDASQPDTIGVPMRSTTKSLVIDYLGQITAQVPGMAKAWTLPRATVAMGTNGLPTGTITHRFPGPLTDVRIIYCPGGGQVPGLRSAAQPEARPLVYEYRNANNVSVWDPGTPIALPAAAKAYTPLWIRPRLGAPSRPFNDEGFLGQQMKSRGFMPGASNDSAVVKDIALLSFYDALPPPVYKSKVGSVNIQGLSPYNTYNRSMMRGIDMTPLITGRRIIVLGHLRSSPSPIPLTVDGSGVDSEGWTVVRWVYDF